MLKVTNISKGFGTEELFSSVSFSLQKNQKIALVGPNGSGKSTLLNIITGAIEADGGQIEIPESNTIGHLPQENIFNEDISVEQLLKNISNLDVIPEHITKPFFIGFDLGALDLKNNAKELSSGQKSKLLLIGILLKNPDFLILDEPTNNLDLPSLIWLEEYLKNSRAGVLVVSHDRRFLDAIADKLIEIDTTTHTVIESKGSYSDYLKRKDIERERDTQLYQEQQEEVKRLTMSARDKKEKAEKGSRFVGTDNDKSLVGFKRERAARSSKVAKAIEKRLGQLEKIEKPTKKYSLEIPLVASKTYGSGDIKIEELVFGYPTGLKIGPLSTIISKGSRVGILGGNGEGKSTLLKTMIGALKPLSGDVTIGSGVILGDLMQEHQTLSGHKTPSDFLKELSNISQTDIYNILGKFNISPKQTTQEISTLSPGLRTRLLLASFSCRGVNTLILDEPTKHLDLDALNALKEVLETYKGTVILVSHDRYFLDTTNIDSLFLIKGGVFSKINSLEEYINDSEKIAKKLLVHS